jgi:hypothetical protein
MLTIYYRYTQTYVHSHIVCCSRQPATPWESELSKLQQVQGQQGGKKGATGSATGAGESMPPGANQVSYHLLIVTYYILSKCPQSTVYVLAAHAQCCDMPLNSGVPTCTAQ